MKVSFPRWSVCTCLRPVGSLCAQFHLFYYTKAGIIVIHGPRPHVCHATWTAPDSNMPWPKALLPGILPGARILTYEYGVYVADWPRAALRELVADYASDLQTCLSYFQKRDATNGRPILFVCHSLEPHVDNLLSSTRGIVFLETPHNTAGLARWIECTFRSMGTTQEWNSDFVNILDNDTKALVQTQEGFSVVPRDSAAPDGYDSIGIRSSHEDMTKFSRIDDPSFIAICGKLREWVKDMDVTQMARSRLSYGDSPPAHLAFQYGDNSKQYNQFGPGTQNIIGSHQYLSEGNMSFSIVS
ncbi:hypothetical protein BDV35DRAFT_385577 [Aspergillus flavus]|uniref:Uncharacterized protein n=1 Tax=Aspergillus flavus TaxID=5059 RepID=A0A5N6GHS2_ASPFL|nr:hypothetical protein BDV35DRAFT_385577 [Aspergillus flavus]